MAFLYYAFQPTILRHADRTACPLDLPLDASDVNCYFGGAFAPFSVVNFALPEASFAPWVARISSHPVTLTRRPLDDRTWDPLTDERLTLQAPDGIFASWNLQDRGERFYYDPIHQRAYYHRDYR